MISRNTARHRVIKALESVDRKRNLGFVKKEKWWKIRCPFHAGGTERTASLQINLDTGSKYFLFCRCFACGKKARWPTVAGALHCDPVYVDNRDKDNVDDYENHLEPAILFDENDRKRFLGNDDTINPPLGFLWPEELNWRTISGEVAREAGAILFIDEIKNIGIQRAFFPLYDPVTQDLLGGVKANLEPQDQGLNYINTEKLPSPSYLLFYDLAERMLNALPKGAPRIVTIEEGPRDTLNIAQWGYPSVCNMGAVYSWTDAKVNHVLRLKPDVFVLLYDGDDAGLAAAEKTMNDIAELVPTHHVILPSKMEANKVGKMVRKKIVDASDLGKRQIDRVMNSACAAFGLPKAQPVFWPLTDN